MSDSRGMDKHITMVGIFHVVYHSIALLIGIAVFSILSLIGTLSEDPEAAWILSLVGTAIALFLIVLSAPGIIAGIGILKRLSWARYLGLIVGALELIDIPLGTALGVYTLWTLLHDETAAAFGKRAQGAPQR